MLVNILYMLTPGDLQQEADHHFGRSALTGVPGPIVPAAQAGVESGKFCFLM